MHRTPESAGENAESTPEVQPRKKIFFTCTVTFFLLVFVSGLLLYTLWRWDSSSRLAVLQAEKRNLTETVRASVGTSFDKVFSDVLFASQLEDTVEVLRGNLQWRRKLEQLFFSMAQANPEFDQIRVINKSGMEVVRVNNNESGAWVVPLDKLQDKGDRYYFTDTMKVSPGKVFVSPLDLNIENGEIEMPYKPMIRVGTPVVNEAMEVIGVVLINYKARMFLDSITEQGVFLLNRKGYFLAGKGVEKSFAFMFKKVPDFPEEYPESWALLQAPAELQTRGPEGILTALPVFPSDPQIVTSDGSVDAAGESNGLHVGDIYYWWIVSIVPRAELDAMLADWRLSYLLVYLGLLLLISLVVLLQGVILFRRERERQDRQRLHRMEGVLMTAGAVCHEINQPLQTVIGYLELMMEGEGTDDSANSRKLRLIGEQARRIQEITLRLKSVTDCVPKDYAGNTKILNIFESSNGAESKDDANKNQ